MNSVPFSLATLPLLIVAVVWPKCETASRRSCGCISDAFISCWWLSLSTVEKMPTFGRGEALAAYRPSMKNCLFWVLFWRRSWKCRMSSLHWQRWKTRKSECDGGQTEHQPPWYLMAPFIPSKNHITTVKSVTYLWSVPTTDEHSIYISIINFIINEP